MSSEHCFRNTAFESSVSTGGGAVPEAVARLLAGRPAVGVTEQAFPFLTVDEAGFPHVALLSRAELAVSPGDEEVHAVVASTRTKSNLERGGMAGLIAIEGTTAHYVKLRVLRTVEAGPVLGCALGVTEHKADSLGIPLSPVSFTATAGIARAEDWAASERLLRALAAQSAG
jgi:hypothetical protein